jgi:hypothetical protein
MHIPTSIPTQHYLLFGQPIVLSYVAAVLVLTAIWVYLFRAQSLRFLSTAMFFPGLLAFAFLWLENGLLGMRHFLSASIFVRPEATHLLYSLVALALNVAVIFATAAVALVLGLAVRSPKNALKEITVHSHNRILLEGMRSVFIYLECNLYYIIFVVTVVFVFSHS